MVEAKSGHSSRARAEWFKKHGYPLPESKEPKLYNLKEDIGQRKDLASKHPEKVEAMRASLKKIREQGYSAPRLAK